MSIDDRERESWKRKGTGEKVGLKDWWKLFKLIKRVGKFIKLESKKIERRKRRLK